MTWSNVTQCTIEISVLWDQSKISASIVTYRAVPGGGGLLWCGALQFTRKCGAIKRTTVSRLQCSGAPSPVLCKAVVRVCVVLPVCVTGVSSGVCVSAESTHQLMYLCVCSDGEIPTQEEERHCFSMTLVETSCCNSSCDENTNTFISVWFSYRVCVIDYILKVKLLWPKIQNITRSLG